MIDRQIFGIFILAKRTVYRQTQRQVAAAARVRIEAVVAAEARRPIGADQFRKLCAWHGTPAEAFTTTRGEKRA